MKYNKIKRCDDVLVSEIALGCEGFIGKSQQEFTAIIDKALELGVNFIDMYTPNPDFRDKLGVALKGRRDKFVLQGHICSVWENGQYLRTRDLEKSKKAFQDQLDRIGTDYMDVGMIHYVDAMSDWEMCIKNGILDYCKELKAQGIIRSIGLSSHNPSVAKAAVLTGDIDVLMFSVNAAYDLLPPSEDVEELLVWKVTKME